MTNLVLLDLLGGVALLLWGLHMVHSGILRAFGANIRRLLSVALAHRAKAFLAGVGVTAVLQSSTATALMVSGFASEGMVGLVPALAILLGANVGTTLVVQVLSFDVAAAAPILLAVGVLAFKRGKRTLTRDLGRVAVGLGLMLLSLHILLGSLAPAESAPLAREILAAATGEPLLNLLLGALLSWAAHSSVAVVLLTMSLGYAHFVTPAAALALILGANLGSAVNPVLESGPKSNRAALRVSLGNLLNRAIGCALVLPFVDPISQALSSLDPSPLRSGADFHTLFNLGTAALFILALGAFARVLERLVPDEKERQDPATPVYLDEAALGSPPLALASAERESLRMGDMVQTMLDRSMTALMTGDRNVVDEVSRMDDVIDRLHKAIKLYVVSVTREELDEREARRAMEVIAFVINMEHIGDIIDKNLMELAAKKIKHKLSFSPEGAAELKSIHEHVLRDLRLAFGIFVSGDAKVARQLLEEKAKFREAEVAASESHFARLREGRPESIETSALHLDILRDLKRIHSHICATAYPVLEAAGQLPRRRSGRSAAENRANGRGSAAGASR